MTTSTDDRYRIAELEQTVRSLAVMLRAVADTVDQGGRIDPARLRRAAASADSIAGPDES